MSIFYPLEVVGRGSEAQLQVVENIILIMYRFKGLHCKLFRRNYVQLQVNANYFIFV